MRYAFSIWRLILLKSRISVSISADLRRPCCVFCRRPRARQLLTFHAGHLLQFVPAIDSAIWRDAPRSLNFGCSPRFADVIAAREQFYFAN